MPNLIARVRRRVESGGHNIPEDTIRRRYERGRRNLVELYLPKCDRWIVYNNSNLILQIIAERPLNQEPIIYQTQLWSQITTNEQTIT